MYSVRTMMSMDTEGLAQAVTDGNHVLATMIELARVNGLVPTFLQYRNSGDVSGDKDRVVGYASIVFHEPVTFNTQEKKDMLALARKAIEMHLEMHL